MRLANTITGAVLLTLAAGSAIASGPIEVVDGDLLVNLGDAASNRNTRTLVLNPGYLPDEVSYVFIDESGVETLGTVSGFYADGDLNIQSRRGKDTIDLLGLQVNNLTINTGSGNDTIKLNLVEANGALDLRSGGGRDTVTLINQVVEGRTSIWTQGGVDYVSISNSYFDRPVAVRTGGGSDTVSVTYTGFDTGRPLFNGQGGNDDTFIDDGGNGFWGGDPRIVRFENIEKPDEPVSCPVEDEARQLMTLAAGESPSTFFGVNSCEVYTLNGAFGVYNGNSGNNGFILGTTLDYFDGTPIIQEFDQAEVEACVALVNEVIGGCNDFAVPE